jgi:tetrahydromethanopterin S-methyltransferase subunit G
MADRPTTPHYGIAKYGPRGTADPMDVYTVYNEAMETIDKILFDLQQQIAKNKQAIIDLDAKVERYNTALNKRIDELTTKVEQYNTALNKRIDELKTKVEQYNTALNKRIDELNTKVEQYHGEFNQFKATTENKFTQVDKHFTQLDGKTDNIWTAITNILNKIQGGGTANKDTGVISWGDTTGKLAIGTINLNSGSGYIRTHEGTLDNDLKAV